MDSFDFSKYIDLALRRKYWIIIPFLLSILGGLTYLVNAKKMYEAQTLILVQPQKVPQDYVRSIISSDIDSRLQTITQQVTSRTNLEKIISEYNLLAQSDFPTNIDDMVQSLRQRIDIKVSKGGGRGAEASAFSISFRGEDPRKVMQVTNSLASNFISENLKIRESQALGTSQFLADELASIKQRLMDKEEQVKEYNLKYMGALPDQLETNLSILGRLQMQLDQLNNNLRDAENRKLIIQQQIAETERMRREAAASGQILDADAAKNAEGRELLTLQKELAVAETRYTPNHPDIIRLKKMIAKLEHKQEKEQDSASGPDSPQTEKPALAANDHINLQMDQIHFEITNIKREIAKVQDKINYYQQLVEDTPRKQQELLSMTRDYENLKELYNSMLNRKLEAEIAVSMEKKQKGEQFRIIDPAKLPTSPVEPDMRKIILVTLVLGLGLGGGLAYFAEYSNPSFKDPKEVEQELQIPILVNLPFTYTEKELKIKKRKNYAFMSGILVIFAVVFLGIIVASKDVYKVIDLLKNYVNF